MIMHDQIQFICRFASADSFDLTIDNRARIVTCSIIYDLTQTPNPSPNLSPNPP